MPENNSTRDSGRKTRRLLHSLLTEVPIGKRLAITIGLLLAGLMEGIGLAALLPLLNMIGGSNAEESMAVTRAVHQVFDIIGIRPSIAGVLVTIVGVIALKALLMLWATRHVGYAVAQLDASFRLRLINTWMKAKWDFFVKQPAGVFINAIGTEATRAAYAFQSVMMMIADAIQVLVYLTAAVFVSPFITLAAVGFGAAIALIFGGFVRASRHAGEHQTRLLRAITIRLSDGLVGMKPIKAMGHEDYLAPLLKSEIDELCNALKRQIFVSQLLKTQHEPLVAVIMAAGLFVAITMLKLELAVIVLLAFLFMRTVNYMLNLQKRYQNYATQESAYSALLDLEEKGRLAQEPTPFGLKRTSLERSIDFDSVSFGYGERAALVDVSLSLPAHSLIVVTGYSGAGKTTFIDLMAGLHQPQAGEIRIDGTPLADVDVGAWRKTIGYVPQEMFLFHDSIYANVAMGDPSVGREQVKGALEATGLWPFIQGLPAGIDTVAGERGSKLSGGQRQRISLARALVGKPQLLILDEVTASLDPEAEKELVEVLTRVKEYTTIIAITHQKQLVEAADHILCVENGRVFYQERPIPIVSAAQAIP